MRSNAWITVEKTRALSWRDWARWHQGEQDDPEPSGLSNFEKKAVRRLADMEYIFKAFLRPTILGKDWVMLSVYDVTAQEIAAGYNQLGDAAQGGDFGCVGYWEWQRGQVFCQYLDLYPWQPVQVTKFMPPTYDENDQPIPATGVRDVNLLFGQPVREFPA